MPCCGDITPSSPRINTQAKAYSLPHPSNADDNNTADNNADDNATDNGTDDNADINADKDDTM
jgi:hypothetical protein